MNIAALYAEMEADQQWRQDEVRFFQNQLASIADEDEKNQFRKALVLVLYAHFEGFCKFALTLYVDSVNASGISCGDANHAIAAASLADIFMALRSPDSKCNEFRNSLPDDTKLHRFARDREFIERITDFANRPVSIPDKVVDTESNLNPIVLRKNLFRLGFPYDLFNEHEGKINKLLGYRNSIAHGERQRGIAALEYNGLRQSTFTIMSEVKTMVMKALQERAFLRSGQTT